MLLNLCPSLPVSELQTLRLDGIVDSSFMPIGAVQTWQSRSLRICDHFPHRVVLTGLSAAWALDLADEPDLHTMAFVDPHRRKNCMIGTTRYEERYFAPSDYWLDGMHGVTTPLRTVLDLLRDTRITVPRLEHTLRLLEHNHGINSADIITSLKGRYKMPYKRLALERIEQIYPSETR